jgi:hypothetical protein
MLKYFLANTVILEGTDTPADGAGVCGVYNNGQIILTFLNKITPSLNFTIMFDQFREKFITFLPFTPNIYLGWRNTYFTPAYFGDTGRLYLHETGDVLSWYDGAVQQDGWIETIYNIDESMPKTFLALMTNTEVRPIKMEFTTNRHKSYLVDHNFEREFDLYVSAIKNDSTESGGNDDDTSKLWGSYITIKMYFAPLQTQKLLNIIIKFLTLNRNYNK